MNPVQKTPCNECPWRRISARGWLGPLKAEEWIELVQSDFYVACHKTIKVNGEVEGTKQCAGAATFRGNVCKSPRDPEIVALPADREKVFASTREFLEHHKR